MQQPECELDCALRDDEVTYGGISLVGEHIDVVVAISCNICLDESAVCDCDLDDVGRS